MENIYTHSFQRAFFSLERKLHGFLIRFVIVSQRFLKLVIFRAVSSSRFATAVFSGIILGVLYLRHYPPLSRSVSPAKCLTRVFSGTIREVLYYYYPPLSRGVSLAKSVTKVLETRYWVYTFVS